MRPFIGSTLPLVTRTATIGKNPYTHGMNSQNGFSLVELMATLAVAAILMTVAVPGFTTLIQNNRMTTTLNDFVSDLALARSEAIKRGSRVTLCKSADGQTCTNANDWTQGWIVFPDPNNNATVDGGETLLRIHEAVRDNSASFVGNGNVADYISFVGTGFSRQINGLNQTGTLSLCDSRGDNAAKALVLNNTGRAYTEDSVAAGTCP